MANTLPALSTLPKPLCQAFQLAETTIAKALPLAYDDASHQVYCLNTNKPSVNSTELPFNTVIKQVRHHSVQNSSFWQQMQLLFSASLTAQIQNFSNSYPAINEITDLGIPTFIDSVQSETLTASMASFCPGQEIEIPVNQTVGKQLIKQLAKHLAHCHQNNTINQTKASPESWQARVNTSLSQQIKEGVIETIKAEQLQGKWGLIMPDLRWDQFLTDGQNLTYLIDLDALVQGPVALEWVLLEYLLTPEQAQGFISEYKKWHEPPIISAVRTIYRHLLFNLNVLGAKNRQGWVSETQHPHYFN